MIVDDQGVLTYNDLRVSRPGDYELSLAYFRMVDEGLLPTIFHSGGIPSVRLFLDIYMDPERSCLACYRIHPNTNELCGMGWISKPQVLNGYSKAEVGMCFFRKRIKKEGERRIDPLTNLTFGRMMLTHFYDHSNIDCIFGTTPEPNKKAWRYAQQLGFSLHGPIPDFATFEGKPVPAWISHLSKKEWQERNKNSEGEA